MARYVKAPVIDSIYRNLKNGNLYRVTCIARPVTAPRYPAVVYEQLYDSELDDFDKSRRIPLPRGTKWSRELKDFTEKFRLVDPSCAVVKTIISSKS